MCGDKGARDVTFLDTNRLVTLHGLSCFFSEFFTFFLRLSGSDMSLG